MELINLQELQQNIEEFVKSSELNQAREIGLEAIFNRPLIGASRADDPLFRELKKEEVIGPHHLSPEEWLEGARTVISYFLPFTTRVRKANRASGQPAPEWLFGRIEGEAFNRALRLFIIQFLEDKGFKAAAPAFDNRFQVENKKSNWSERHAAYIAGLGTFGLSRSLITERGCAGRYGSVITTLPLPAVPRKYGEIYGYCNNCGECITRCPVGAITAGGKDVSLCFNYLEKEIKPRYNPRYGCGKCQTRVPCEKGIPPRKN